MVKVFRIGIVVVAVGLAAGVAQAIPRSASTTPDVPTATDIVILRTEMVWNSSGFSVTGQSLTFVSPTSIEINIAVSAPGRDDLTLAVITEDVVTTSLGILPVGTYTFTITEMLMPRGIDPGFGPDRQLTGQFFVVPEPSSALLLGVGLVLFRCQRQKQLPRLALGASRRAAQA